MPPSRVQKRASTRRIVRDHALRVFSQRGFENVTVDELIAPLEISRRSFFRHFPSKEDVVLDWYEEITTKLVHALRERPASERPFPSVQAALGSLLEFYDADPKWALAIMKLSRSSPALIGKSLEKRSHWQKELAAVLATRMKGKERDLRAAIIVGACLETFFIAVDKWALAEGREELRAIAKKAFSQLTTIEDP